MSIGIYAFLRIYFLNFGLSDFAQFRTRSTPSSVQPPVRSSQRVLSGIECRPVQRVQHPGVCLALRGLPCIWHGLRRCLCCAAVPGALVAGVSTGGVYGESRGWGGQSLDFRSQRKRQFLWVSVANTHPTFTKRNLSDCASLQKFQKIQKDPSRSLDCGIIS